jgi:hypothetical protein
VWRTFLNFTTRLQRFTDLRLASNANETLFPVHFQEMKIACSLFFLAAAAPSLAAAMYGAASRGLAGKANMKCGGKRDEEQEVCSLSEEEDDEDEAFGQAADSCPVERT